MALSSSPRARPVGSRAGGAGVTSTPPVFDVDAPLRLSKAAAIAFPDGSMTKSGLRREAARGRLVIQRIAGKDYTTLRAIGDMVKLCTVAAKQPAPRSDDLRAGRPHSSGPAMTAEIELAVARARHKLSRLKTKHTASPAPVRARR
jgi:hypothetical protein